jgi:hypothetical protein
MMRGIRIHQIEAAMVREWFSISVQQNVLGACARPVGFQP